MNLNKKALGVAVAVALLSTSAFAVSPYGNTNQKGSLLVFPLIDISDGKDTLIRITNDYSSDVDIKCYYQSTDRGNYKVKYRADLSFNLTKFQPGHWWASTGRSSGYADKGFNVRRFGDMPSNGAADKDGYVARRLSRGRRAEVLGGEPRSDRAGQLESPGRLRDRVRPGSR